MTFLLVLLGVGWRSVRYLERFPVWGDEAFVCLNFLDRDYLGLLRPLRFSQVAPVLFLWGERTACCFLGGSELSIRFLPFLAGVAAVGLFWRLARSTLSPLAAAMAVGLLAVSYYPVRHSCEAKPYAFDLLAAIGLLLPAVAWLNRPTQVRPILLLTLVAPIALGLSYPAAFVAGAISLVLLGRMYRTKGRALAVYVVYNIVLVLSFASWYLLVGLGQFTSTHGTQNVQWDMWFPPAQIWELIQWLAAAHSGNMFAYPIGGPNCGSIVTTLLCAIGAWHLAKERRRDLLALCLMPFLLTLAAAALHRYPYGGSARVAQHLAPLICLLAGNGIAGLHSMIASRRLPISNWQFFGCVAGLLAFIGFAGLLRDAAKPYKTAGDQHARRLAGTIAAYAGPDDQVIVLNEDWRLPPGMEWYLRQHGVRLSWNGQLDKERLATSTQQIWILAFVGSRQRWSDLEQCLRRNPRAFVLASQAEYHLPFGWDVKHGDQCRLLYLVASNTEAEESGVITAEGDARSIGSGLAPAALDKQP